MPATQLQAMMPDSDRVIMLGSLWKEKKNWMSKIGAPMGNMRFHMRFFALINARPTRLCAWKEESMFRNREEPEHTIPLDGCSLSCAEKHTGNPHSFGIFHPERSEVYLLCPDADQYHKWMQALEGMLINPQQLRLKDFDFMTMVGRGSFGQVFQVRKKDTKRVYALKVLEKSYVKKQAQVENTKSERKVLEIVNHPFIVSLHYAFQTGKALCLVMDFINGGELFMHLKQQRYFCEADAKIWAAEILLALEYLHSMDIIYRDIKPENVLLDREGHIKITDFGLARDRTDTVNSSTVAGSPYYMAPEVLLMQGHDVQADWWSLGILIYEMLVGLPPFYCENAREAYQRLLSRPIEFPDHVSDNARELIRGLLKANPVHRLGAKTQKRQASKLLAEGWGDGMPIKAQKWFKGVRWDQVLLKHVKPSFTPQLKDDMDVSNFDDTFTHDKSWRNSKLLRHTSFEEVDLDEFDDFNYVKNRSSHSPTPVASRPSMTLDELTLDNRNTSDPDSPHCRCPKDMARKYQELTSDSFEAVPPWRPRRRSIEGNASGSDVEIPAKGMLGHLSEEESREFLKTAPQAKQGYLESTKKGPFGYVTPKRKYLRLVPSLGCVLVYKDHEGTIPTRVIPVPGAGLIYPKQGAVPVGRKVFVHSVRMLVDEKPYTFLCENQVEKDTWVAALRAVGERWRYSDQPGLQMMEMINKTGRAKTLMQAMFGSETKKETWQAIQRDGQTIDLMSEKGEDREGTYRYDGEQTDERRHGRGLCSYNDFEHYYDGFWKKGRKEGHAIVKFKGVGLYEGRWDPEEKRQGYGKMLYDNGSMYDGWWVANARQGYGYQWWAESNEAHHGFFQNDVPHGQGTRHYPSGKVYSGGWLNGNKHGVGVMQEPEYETDGGSAGAAEAGGGKGMTRVKSRACIDGDAFEVDLETESPTSPVEEGPESPEQAPPLWGGQATNFTLEMDAEAGEKATWRFPASSSPQTVPKSVAKSESVTPLTGPTSHPADVLPPLTSTHPKLKKVLEEWGGFGRGQLGSFSRGDDDNPGGGRISSTPPSGGLGGVRPGRTESEVGPGRAESDPEGRVNRSLSAPDIHMSAEFGTHDEYLGHNDAASDSTGPITAIGPSHSPTFGSPPDGGWAGGI